MGNTHSGKSCAVLSKNYVVFIRDSNLEAAERSCRKENGETKSNVVVFLLVFCNIIGITWNQSRHLKFIFWRLKKLKEKFNLCYKITLKAVLEKYDNEYFEYL